MSCGVVGVRKQPTHRTMGSGTYFYRQEAGTSTDTRMMTQPVRSGPHTAEGPKTLS